MVRKCRSKQRWNYLLERLNYFEMCIQCNTLSLSSKDPFSFSFSLSLKLDGWCDAGLMTLFVSTAWKWHVSFGEFKIGQLFAFFQMISQKLNNWLCGGGWCDCVLNKIVAMFHLSRVRFVCLILKIDWFHVWGKCYSNSVQIQNWSPNRFKTIELKQRLKAGNKDHSVVIMMLIKTLHIHRVLRVRCKLKQSNHFNKITSTYKQ